MQAERPGEIPARLRARIAGVFYLITFITGAAALMVRGNVGRAAGLIAGVSYVIVTLLFYYIFRPVNRKLSLVAAFVSLVGFAIGPLGEAHLVPRVNPLIFFGIYCLLIGYLIFHCTFLPRILGALMAFAGLGWLTFVYAPFASHLSPYNIAPGLIGEGALTLWLLAKGVDEGRWNALAATRRH